MGVLLQFFSFADIGLFGIYYIADIYLYIVAFNFVFYGVCVNVCVLLFLCLSYLIFSFYLPAIPFSQEKQKEDMRWIGIEELWVYEEGEITNFIFNKTTILTSQS